VIEMLCFEILHVASDFNVHYQPCIARFITRIINHVIIIIIFDPRSGDETSVCPMSFIGCLYPQVSVRLYSHYRADRH
jgi:hypothetical protein